MFTSFFINAKLFSILEEAVFVKSPSSLTVFPGQTALFACQTKPAIQVLDG